MVKHNDRPERQRKEREGRGGQFTGTAEESGGGFTVIGDALTDQGRCYVADFSGCSLRKVDHKPQDVFA